MSKNIKSISKHLSLVLRHQPEHIDLQLDEQGWANVDELIARMSAKGHALSLELLTKIVETNDKKRFAFSADGQLIRASQGHSIDVDLKLRAIQPPEVLYHGTATRFIDDIRSQGLVPMSRQHVHLSAELKTATAVAQRHGKPHILLISAELMAEEGYQFYQSENGVWLTDSVPLKFIKFSDSDERRA